MSCHLSQFFQLSTFSKSIVNCEFLSVYNRRNLVIGKDFLCHRLKRLCSQIVDALEKFSLTLELTVVQKTFCRAQNGVLKVVGSNAYLALYLPLCRSKNGGRQRFVAQIQQFALNQTDALFVVVLIAAKIDAPGMVNVPSLLAINI